MMLPNLDQHKSMREAMDAAECWVVLNLAKAFGFGAGVGFMLGSILGYLLGCKS